MLRALIAIAVLLPSVAGACPVADRVAAGGLSADPAALDVLRDDLARLPAGTCADELLTALVHHSRPDFVEVVVNTVSTWPDELALPWLTAAWGQGWFTTGGRHDEVLPRVADALSRRTIEGGFRYALQTGALPQTWLDQARNRYLTQWGPALTSPPPPLDEEARAAIHRRWRRCLLEPPGPPPDPFDPRGMIGGAFGSLSEGSRCTSAALLRHWQQGNDDWSGQVEVLVRQYSNQQSGLGDLVQRLETSWSQGSALNGGAPVPSPDEPLPPPPWTPWLQGLAGFAAFAFLLSAPKRTRKLGFPLLAVALGGGLVILGELGLEWSGAQPGDVLRPRLPLPMQPVDIGEGRTLYVDARSLPYAPGRQDHVPRVGLIGASSAVGPGLSEPDSLSGRLRSILLERMPCVEVINLGMHGAASPAFRSWSIEALDTFGLDGVVLYGGHNEVADTREANRYLGLDPDRLRLRGHLTRLHLWGALHGLIGAETELPELTEAQRAAADESQRSFSEFQSRFDATVTARAEREFIDLARALKRADVPLVVALPSFNHHALRVGLPDQPAENVNVDFMLARLEDDPDLALELAEKAVKELPEYGGLWMALSLAREQVGDLEGAEEAIWEAARRNQSGSAVTPGVVSALRAAAEQHGALVDVHAALHVASGPHLPGYDLFIDYVHLNPLGAEYAAIAIADAAQEAGYIDRWAARCPEG